jgi:hypothetical protein
MNGMEWNGMESDPLAFIGVLPVATGTEPNSDKH